MFLGSYNHYALGAKHFLKRTLASCHITKPLSIPADGDKSYPVVICELKKGECILLHVKKYVNNSMEQDYRFIKKQIQNMLELKTTIAGIEALHMTKKDKLSKNKGLSKSKYILFMTLGLIAYSSIPLGIFFFFSYPTIFVPEPFFTHIHIVVMYN
ncbi:insertion sequence IS240 protein [Bacillus thuringiensis Sbt003]|uniref:DDE domain-containing protein n=2 Tax=Bacillus cereus group TaxID=86661 RepID=A0A9W5NZH4_BACCE|nr:hypothetical protein IK5_05797 [Bacillus cereus VD154]KIU74541.1 insertion sequence IS240 protein [Bacillus thuringiensis Sbt003]